MTHLRSTEILRAGDPLGPIGRDSPIALYRALRDEAPLFFHAERETWILSRFSDVQAAARDWETFTPALDGVDFDHTTELVAPGSFLDQDPPAHSRLRGVLRPLFTPRAVATLEPFVETVVDQLLDEAFAASVYDFADRFAWQLPLTLVSHLAGFRDVDLEWLRRVLVATQIRDPGQRRVPPLARAAYDEFVTAMTTEVRSADPERSDSILSLVRAALARGDVKDEEMPGLMILVIGAGVITTVELLTAGIEVLARREELRWDLVRDHGLVAPAIEEIARLEPPLPFMHRTATRDVALHGETIKKGERVALHYAAANRDERQFADPDEIDLGRPNPRAHLAFGNGVHFCLGAPLARMEVGTAFRRILRRSPDFEVVGPSGQAGRFVTTLPMTFTDA